MSRRNSTSGVGSTVSGGSATFTGDVTAARFLGSANNTAAAPTFLVEPAGNSGLYWDATTGVSLSVDAVARFLLRVNGIAEITSGVAGNSQPVLRLTSTSGNIEMFTYGATPESVITGSPGDVVYDPVNGRFYLKRSGSGNTGWVQIDRCESGTYTPTATLVLNLDSVTPSVATYMRVGDMVLVQGSVSFDPTAASQVTFGLSLPIASALASSNELSGAGGSWGTFINADTANDRANLQVFSSTAAATAMVYLFSYRVL